MPVTDIFILRVVTELVPAERCHSGVAHANEAGITIDGKRPWQHCLSNGCCVLY